MEFMNLEEKEYPSDEDDPFEDDDLDDEDLLEGPSAPPDPEPEMVSTRLKLESPHMYEKQSPQCHEEFNSMLVKCLGEHEIEIEESYVEEADEMDLVFLQRFYTTTYKIKSDRFDRILFKALRQFLTEVKEMQVPAHMNPTVILPSGECFSDALVTHHSDVSVAAIYFGNVQGGVYLSHWEVSDDRLDSFDRASDKFFANFEYDRRDMVLVKFRNREEKRRQDGQSHYVDMHYQIIVTRDSIRRIVVNNAISNAFGKDRTALHFEVNCPPVIKNGFFGDEERHRKFAAPNYQRQTMIKRGTTSGRYSKDAAIADSPYFTIEFAKKVEMPMIYAILSRLRSRCGVSVEFAHLPIIDCWVWQNAPYFSWDPICDKRRPSPTSDRNPVYSEFLKWTCPRDPLLPAYQQDENRRKRFIITYLLECLLSRGAVVKDQLCLQYEHWFGFLRIIQKQMSLSFDRCERALEKLVVMIDERKRLGCLHRTLIDIFEMLRKQDLDPTVTDSEKREGYQRVRKIIITPTRMMYVVPEMMMSNRVLRKYDEHGVNILRVSFRDDNNSKMREQTTSKDILRRRVEDFLNHGFYIAGTDFGYLGSSNSQMRDHGAYFMQKNAHWDIKDWRKHHPNERGGPPKEYMEQIYRVRRELGKFETVDSVPKLMARLGQCFTQSRESGVKLAAQDVCTTYDAIGGNNSNGQEYTFSDGVGCISNSRAKKIALDMRLGKGWPSCYQFRYRGMKGVLAVNLELDDRAKWAKELGLLKVTKPDFGDAQSWEVHFVFRDSQIKFRGARQDNVEIVKCSSPSPVSLNRPFINILDQVSELQGKACHQRMCNRIEELLDRQLRSFATQMIDEHQCRNRLKELPRRVDIDCINEKAGFEVSSEPFFRSLIKAAVKYSVAKQLRKEQIQIPFEKGRTMLGVVDESDQLQYGQVFVRYTKTIRDKFPPPGAAKQVLKGKVLLTKNPCIVAGDVRVFEAVDIPQLHHLVDVIVFPKHGPRPHPDEMAGSDLDGDEYCVIWDKDLFIERNEAPFDFTVPKRKDDDILTNLQAKMARFYLDYMTQDAVGTISNAFLFQSDLYGINHKVCMQLAKKNCEAVDFTKSGMPPEPLTKTWKEDEDGNDIPPEKAERVPDFHFGNDQPVYESRRLIGKLYREIKTIEDVLRISEDRDEQMEIEVDELLRYTGWEKYQQKAMDELAKYNTLLRTIMDTYGIRTEAEVLTGYILEMRNRISDKDQDDMSFYNTNQMIETRITGLFRRFREEFFEEFGGWRQALTKVEKPFADENNVCHYQVNNPSEDMKMKASAYYVVCYARVKESREKKLSFAWLAYDVLAQIKQDRVATDNIVISGNPLWVMIADHMKAYTEENQEKYDEFHEFCFGRSGDVSTAIEPLHKYCRRYEGLDKVLFIITEWGSSADLYTSNFKRAHLALLAILYYINAFSSLDGDALCIFDQIDTNLKPEEVEPDILAQPEHVLVKFFEFLASRKFARLKHLSYSMLGVQAVFLRGEWIPLHKAGLKTYYNLVFNLRFEDLLLNSQKEAFAQAVIRECESFTIDLPEKVVESTVRLQLIKKTGVEEVQLRRQQKSRVLVSARGTLEALDRLRKLVTVKPPPNSAVSGKEISAQLVNLVYEKIMSDRSPHL